jgi:hypothetical protein
MQRNETYIQYVVAQDSPSSPVYISVGRKKLSRVLVAGGSALALIALVSLASFTGDRLGTTKRFILKTGDEFDTIGTDDRMKKISDVMGKYYHNVLVGNSFICSPGSFLRKNEKERTSCVNCPTGQVKLHELS